ncbi:MAG: FecR domain-containing protein [Runella sp.]
MPDYTHYSIADLVLDDYFLESCLNPTPATDAFWQEWLEQYPQCQTTWQEAKYIIEALAEGRKNYALVRLPEDKVEALWQRIQATSFVEDNVPLQPTKEIKSNRKMWWWAAASVLLVGVLGYVWLNQNPLSVILKEDFNDSESSSLGSFQSIQNIHSEPQKINLSDGSQVVLMPQATLRYPDHFDDTQRVVYLEGEAEFDIKSDAQRPFLVYTNSLITKVLGTKFKVLASSTLTKVSVISGKVSVIKRTAQGQSDAQTALILLPNQQITYDAVKKDLVKTLVEDPLMLQKPTQPQAFEFDETPVSEVFERLMKAYNINIIFEESNLKNCTLTASLTPHSLYVKLDLICETLHLEYTIVDGQIVVSGKGCH